MSIEPWWQRYPESPHSYNCLFDGYIEAGVRNYKTRGIILKSYDFGEADKIITILSDSYGKLKAVAKGVRKTKSRFGARLEPFTYVDLMLVRGRTLDIITGADIICSFREIKRDLDRMTCGFGMVDLVDKVTVEKQEEVEVFHLLLKSFETLEKSHEHYALLLAAFDLKLIAYCGYLPDLTSCVNCKKTGPFVNYFLSLDQGGIICPDCNHSSLMTRIASADAIKILRSILKKDIDAVQGTNGQELEKEITGLLKDYIDYYVQARLKSREYLSKVT